MNPFVFRLRHLFLIALPFIGVLPSAHGQGSATMPSIDLASCAKPEWPVEALRKHQHGTVTLEFHIEADGRLSAARVAATSFHPLLDEAARAALSLCRFKPALKNGKPVGATLRTPHVWAREGATTSQFAGAPAHLRAYFEQARQADAIIVNRMERCLAFPDFPGNQWPAGLAKQYCDVTAGKHVHDVDVKIMLQKNQIQALDAAYRRDLERHFAQGDHSEAIHKSFLFFRSPSGEADRASQEWLTKAPNSPFANAARGLHLNAKAAEARGGEWARQTSQEQMNKMAELNGVAQTFLEKALRLEPRLMPAYVGLIYIGRTQTGTGLTRRAFARGAAVDAGCRNLTRARMDALLPRWGGSYEEMYAVIEESKPLVARRPLMALNFVLPAIDQADFLQRDKQYADVVKVLEPAARIAPFDILFMRLGTNMAINGGDRWEVLARLLASYRYSPNEYHSTAMRARILLDVANDAAWAMVMLKQAAAIDPTQARIQYDMGRAYLQLSEFELAEKSFTAALASPEYQESALHYLVQMADTERYDARLAERSGAYVATFPQQPRGYYLLGYAKMRAGDAAQATAAFKTFVQLAKTAGDSASYKERITLATRYIDGDRTQPFIASMQAGIWQ